MKPRNTHLGLLEEGIQHVRLNIVRVGGDCDALTSDVAYRSVRNPAHLLTACAWGAVYWGRKRY